MSSSISPFLIVAAPFLLAVVVAVLVRRSAGHGKRVVTEPSCGRCGYCVRGISTLICPECGSDLREVGIRTPGSTAPMSRGMRLLTWTIMAVTIGLLLGSSLSPVLAPWTMATRQRRVIFSHASYLNTMITVERTGAATTLGRRGSPPAPLQSMRLELANRP